MNCFFPDFQNPRVLQTEGPAIAEVAFSPRIASVVDAFDLDGDADERHGEVGEFEAEFPEFEIAGDVQDHAFLPAFAIDVVGSDADDVTAVLQQGWVEFCEHGAGHVAGAGRQIHPRELLVIERVEERGLGIGVGGEFGEIDGVIRERCLTGDGADDVRRRGDGGKGSGAFDDDGDGAGGIRIDDGNADGRLAFVAAGVTRLGHGLDETHVGEGGHGPAAFVERHSHAIEPQLARDDAHVIRGVDGQSDLGTGTDVLYLLP